LTHLIHGVEDQRLLDEVQKRAAALGRTCDVLLQVHIAQEETKHGLSPDELRAAVAAWPWSSWPNVRVRGLMGMATNTDDMDRVRAEFQGLHRLFDEVRGSTPFAQDMPPVLSMGMSGDAAIAVASGSTLVRIGTSIFGAR
jgi:uncharacterized pyridoxal phosphate-containing UPF0001 family protein